MKLTETERLYLPYDAPLPATVGGLLPSVPQLWERARLFFTRVIKHIGSTPDLSKRGLLTRNEKAHILGWLEPVEKLARSCLIVRAINFLLMTPEGRRLMRETPKMAMPEPRRKDPNPPRITRIPIWHTHAPYARVLAERRKIEEQKAAERAARDKYDPTNWGGGFRVLRWYMPDDPDRPAPKKKMPQWAELLRASLDPDPVGAYRTRHPPRTGSREPDPPALVLARRIEALSRVLANPQASTMRLARFMAKLPLDALDLLKEAVAFPRGWLHGADDARHGAAHVRRAAAVLCVPDTG